jgi:hypothetical protein
MVVLHTLLLLPPVVGYWINKNSRRRRRCATAFPVRTFGEKEPELEKLEKA